MPDGVNGYITGSWSVVLGSNPNLALTQIYLILFFLFLKLKFYFLYLILYKLKLWIVEISRKLDSREIHEYGKNNNKSKITLNLKRKDKFEIRNSFHRQDKIVANY